MIQLGDRESCFCGRAMLWGQQCCLERKILLRLFKLLVSFLSRLLRFSMSMGRFFAVMFNLHEGRSTSLANGSLIWAINTGVTLPCGDLGLRNGLDVLNVLREDCWCEARAANMWAGGKQRVYVIHALVSTPLYIKEMRKRQKEGFYMEAWATKTFLLFVHAITLILFCML